MANRVVAPVRGCACALLFASLGVASVTPNIVLSSNLPSPQPVGTLVTFTATVAGGPVGAKYDYQFSVGSPGKQFEIRLDFGPKSKFAWAQNDSEGTFTIRAVVRNRSATPIAVYGPVTVDYVVAARVPLNGPSAVFPTDHPLVALFSTTPCAPGNTKRVLFQEVGSAVSATTNATRCVATTTRNFLVAGMHPDSRYDVCASAQRERECYPHGEQGSISHRQPAFGRRLPSLHGG